MYTRKCTMRLIVTQAVDPDEYALVTKAASRELLFEGGPQPWVLDPSTYFETLHAANTDTVKRLPVKDTQST